MPVSEIVPAAAQVGGPLVVLGLVYWATFFKF